MRDEVIPTKEIHAILDAVRFGDVLTVTRSNGGRLRSTVSGPAIAAPDVSQSVGIDLLDGGPHTVRDRQGGVWGDIVAISIDRGSRDGGRIDPPTWSWLEGYTAGYTEGARHAYEQIAGRDD